jgi:hypothetical protein
MGGVIAPSRCHVPAPEVRAIAGEVIQAMDVAVAGELQATRSASLGPFWNIVTDIDLSAAGDVTPDDALTRFRYVIRNLPRETFVSTIRR